MRAVADCGKMNAADSGNNARAAVVLSAEQIENIRRNPPLNMSPAEAAAYIGVSIRKLRQDTKARLLPVVRLGRRLIYRRDSLDEAIRRLELRAV